MSSIIDELQPLEGEMKDWFADLHKHPELGFEEHWTAAYIAEKLAGWGYEVETGIGGTGLVATMTAASGAAADGAAGGAAGRKTIALRADMDALPIQEAGSCFVKSEVAGVSHMCGHDGHCTMLLGAAKYLAEHRNFNGTLKLIFQPAEEPMLGAKAMMADGLLDRHPVDAVFGMHNMPGMEQGKVFFREGPLLTAVDNWEITLCGKGVHGAQPHKGIDPVVAGSALVMALQTIVSRNVNPRNTAVVTVGSFQAGEVGNIVPQTAVLKLSMRSAEPEARQVVLAKVRSITEAIAQAYGCAFSIEEGQPGAVLVNDAELKRECCAIAAERLGEDRVDPNGEPAMPSEDFAFYAQKIPGFYAFLGNGDTQANHHPEYTFNLANLVPGAAYWVIIAEGMLK